MNKSFKLFSMVAAGLFLASCGRSYETPASEKFTLGSIQMKVHKGMSQGEVAEAMGAPNIVTKDNAGTTTWIYDKIATDVEYYERGGGFWLVITGGGGNRGGARTNQRTLTAVVKFNSDEKVDNLTYHSSNY